MKNVLSLKHLLIITSFPFLAIFSSCSSQNETSSFSASSFNPFKSGPNSEIKRELSQINEKLNSQDAYELTQEDLKALSDEGLADEHELSQLSEFAK